MTAANPTGQVDLDEVRRRIENAQHLVGALASGEQRWKMTIPADPERDSDLILAAALNDAEALLADLDAARQRVAELEAYFGRPGVPTYEQLSEAFGDALKQVEDWRGEMKTLVASLDAAEAERDRMRPVVEAVGAWMVGGTDEEIEEQENNLALLFEAYEAQEGTDG